MPIKISKKFKYSRDKVASLLEDKNIHTKKYFYPLISDFDKYKAYVDVKEDKLDVSKKASNEILCLPIYPDLEESELNYIIETIRGL